MYQVGKLHTSLIHA